jgi:hypothetical protein
VTLAVTTTASPGAGATLGGSPGAPLAAFPSFDPFSLRFPIRAADWTIWPDDPQTWAEWVLGHPLELNPCTYDYLLAACDGQRLRLEPHYELSTWDTFFIDLKGVVEVTAFRGAFQETLGSQPRLLEGVCAVLDELIGVVGDAALKGKLQQICDHIWALCAPGPQAPGPVGAGPVGTGGPTMTGTPTTTGTPSTTGAPPADLPLRGLSRAFWAWKLCAGRPRPKRPLRARGAR